MLDVAGLALLSGRGRLRHLLVWRGKGRKAIFLLMCIWDQKKNEREREYVLPVPDNINEGWKRSRDRSSVLYSVQKRKKSTPFSLGDVGGKKKMKKRTSLRKDGCDSATTRNKDRRQIVGFKKKGKGGWKKVTE